ncbi:MAG: hemolysin III family protein [Actinomycetota bacterium]|nr:hemolysin III family protein [Actinomycetota bacterium]MDQ6948783.1 hemolysin III family protein [Actinomycetota bacterium]
MLPEAVLDERAEPGRRVVRLSGIDVCPRWRGRLHLGALVVALPAAALLYTRRPSAAVALYVIGLVTLFAISSAYHLLPVSPTLRRRLRLADHATIYLFIAACYTPFCVVAVKGPAGSVVLGAAWTGALSGAVLKLTRFDHHPVTGAVLYLALGWLLIAVLPGVIDRLGTGQLVLLAATGASYTMGALVLFTRRPDPRPHLFGYHEIWHAAVVVASACYFVVIWSLPVP